MEYKRYEKYKDSGVEWIGEIPEYWQISKVKYVTAINRTTLPENTDEDYEIQYIDISSVNKFGEYDNIQTMEFRNAPSRARRVVLNGDTIVSTVRTYLKAIAYIDNAYNNLICSTGFAVLTPKNRIKSKYLFYLMRSDIYVNEIVRNSVGVSYPAVNASDIGALSLLLPSQKDQIDIVTFLDQKTSEIDNIISDKENLISLLQEQRQAIITEAVTKGLNPHEKMKDSGIEWIGEIPEHWEVKRLKHLFEIVKRLYYMEDRDVLSITQKGIKIKDLQSNEGQHAQTYAGYQLVNVNDFAMNSMDLLTGYVDCSKFEGVTSPDYRVFRFHKNNIQNHDYYTYLFQMCYTNKIFYGFGQGVSNFGRWRLQTEVFLNFLLPQPTLQEQINIANFLDNKTIEIDDLIDKTKIQIQNMKDYRQSLISEAVTGKIDVRD